MLKRLILVAVAALSVGLVSMALAPFHDRIVHAWLNWRYPPSPLTSTGPLGRQILAELRGQRFKDVAREYARVQALVEEARAQGLDVAGLEPTMALAKKWMNAGRSEAMVLINSVEMIIPRKKQSLAQPQPKPVAAKTKKKTGRVRRRS